MKITNFLKELVSKIFKVNFIENDLVNYLYSGEGLPRALNDKEELELISMLDSGSEEAKQKLIEHNLRLVVYIAKKFENTGVDIEDLISIGSIGLIKAINSFKGDKNIKIATYSSRCIENEILMYLRKISKQKNEVSIDEPVNTDGDGNELLITDLVALEDNTPVKDMEQNFEKEMLWKILNKLNEREKEIMLMRYGLNGLEEKTQKEVADDLGISQSYISRLEKKILNQIKKEMQKLA